MTGNFNPGNAAGQKIFLENTKGLPADQHLTLTGANAQSIMAQFKVKEQLMGAVVTRIPSEYYATEAVITRMNLIHQCTTLGLEMVQRKDFGHFGTDLSPNDPIPEQPWTTAILDPENVDGDKQKFYDQGNANVVIEIIKNNLTPGAWDNLMLQHEKSSFVNADGNKNYDGPKMTKVLIEDIDTYSSINIELHRQAIKNDKLQNFKGNVSKMLKSTEHHFQFIVGNGNTYDSETYRRHLLVSLLTGSNAEFNTNIKIIKSDVEAGCG